jgi:hypothetical protein
MCQHAAQHATVITIATNNIHAASPPRAKHQKQNSHLELREKRRLNFPGDSITDKSTLLNPLCDIDPLRVAMLGIPDTEPLFSDGAGDRLEGERRAGDLPKGERVSSNESRTDSIVLVNMWRAEQQLSSLMSIDGGPL